MIECRLQAAAWSASLIDKAGPTGLGTKKMEEPCVLWSAVRVEAITAYRATGPGALACTLSRLKYAFLRSSCCQPIPICAQTGSMFGH